jgi:cystathionine beta-lyase
MHIEKFTYENTDFFNACMSIRTVVFVDEQKVDQALEQDGRDSECIHYILFDEGKAIGTVRRRFTENGLKLERLAILKEYRGKGYAHHLMSFILKDILPCKQKIYMHAQEGVEEIYKKYGFKIVGDRFTEAGIGHYLMEHENNGELTITDLSR